jgi:hypothetical protein
VLINNQVNENIKMLLIHRLSAQYLKKFNLSSLFDKSKKISGSNNTISIAQFSAS